MTKKYKTHNVIKERIDLYKDFTINLIYYIHDTYFGRKYIYKKEDIDGHFRWCFMKVLDEFYDEEIDFFGNEELYEYFYVYFTNQFYKFEKPMTLNHYISFWNKAFELTENKNKKMFDILIQLYEIFETSINVKEKELFM